MRLRSVLVWIALGTAIAASACSATETQSGLDCDPGSDSDSDGDTDGEADAGSDSGADTDTDGFIANVCLDPGHPSSDGDKLWESIINRKVGFYLEDLLRAAGYDVLQTTDDIDEETIFADDFDNEGPAEQAMLVVTSLESRTDDCNAWPADYFISIHHNAVTDTSVNYTLTIYGEDSGYEPWFTGALDWASITTDYLYDAMNVDGYQTWGDRSALGYGLWVLQNTEMIGILTEGSFYSNPDEYGLLNTSNDYLYGEAEAIFAAFAEFTAG